MMKLLTVINPQKIRQSIPQNFLVQNINPDQLIICSYWKSWYQTGSDLFLALTKILPQLQFLWS